MMNNIVKPITLIVEITCGSIILYSSFELFHIGSILFNMSGVIAQLLLLWICYSLRAICGIITSLAILITIDNISNENLDNGLDQANINLDINYESFTLILLNNLLLYDGSTIIDCSLIIGNQIDTLLSGFLIVFSLYFEVARHFMLIF